MKHRTLLTALALAIGCTPLSPAPSLVAADARVDAVDDAADAAKTDADRSDAVDADAPPADVTPPDVVDAASDVIDAPSPDASDASDAGPVDVAPPTDVPVDAPFTGPRLTGTFVSSGVSSARLSGGFVWHGTAGSTRLQGWLQ